MAEKEMVLNTSPEAASIQTVTGWVSRDGRFWGDDERMARYDGCTHVACNKCGEPVEKGWLACRKCRDQADTDRYNAMPRKPWDGNMVYSQARDRYYQDPGDAEDELEEGETLADLQLVLCEPNYGRKLDPDHFCDELPDDDEGELPDILYDAIDAFNAAVEKVGPLPVTTPAPKVSTPKPPATEIEVPQLKRAAAPRDDAPREAIELDINIKLDELGDLFEYWKRRRAAGYTPMAIRAALVSVIGEIAGHTAPVI